MLDETAYDTTFEVTYTASQAFVGTPSNLPPAFIEPLKALLIIDLQSVSQKVLSVGRLFDEEGDQYSVSFVDNNQ